DCAALPDIAKNGVKGACTDYGVIRTIGGMVLAYNTKALAGKQPTGWKDFFDVQNFPGPRSLPDTGDREWWVPVAALAADGVPA
ncbi:extracellular solute-binding protein, partial [Acinetobacter baumannii]